MRYRPRHGGIERDIVTLLHVLAVARSNLNRYYPATNTNGDCATTQHRLSFPTKGTPPTARDISKGSTR